MTDLSIPKDASQLPDVSFNPADYRAEVAPLTGSHLDTEIERTVDAGFQSLAGFALAFQQNAIARHERGKRTEKISPKISGADGGKALRSDNALSAVERKQRSEDMVVAEYLTDDEVHNILADGKGFNTMVTVARARKRESQVADDTVTVNATPADWTNGDITVLRGDFRDRLADLPDGSVDLIVTDPPYPKDDLPLWSDLGEHAARLLGPRGILLAWTGQLFLPEVMDRLGEHLTYGWMFSLQLPGSGSRIMGRHIIQGWKPVLAYTVGTWPSGKWGDDVLVSPSREKARYEWEQNAAPARRLIERFSAKGALVVDPFLGVGSFGVAAQQANRRFIGVELDEGRFATSTDRLANQVDIVWDDEDPDETETEASGH